ncbi:MAG TPA: hypothetical protein VK484_11510 [Ferruginibacter sp.]|nr:hypothetical protein [Ferruginibacter sp.]
MKKIILAAALFLCFSSSYSQTFMHGAGITVIGSTTAQGRNSDIGFGEGFTYFPRINFVETESLSVSAGIPLVLGISATTSTSTDSYGYVYDNSSVGFVFQAPLIINLNMGRGSTKENTQKFGWFPGAGFGFHHGAFITDNYDPVTDTYFNSYSSNTFGPAGNAGVRLGVGRKHKNIEIRLSYMKGINENKPNVFGIAGAFNF